MKEITFKAETEEELFFMVQDFLNGYELNNGKIIHIQKNVFGFANLDAK